MPPKNAKKLCHVEFLNLCYPDQCIIAGKMTFDRGPSRVLKFGNSKNMMGNISL